MNGEEPRGERVKVEQEGGGGQRRDAGYGLGLVGGFGDNAGSGEGASSLGVGGSVGGLVGLLWVVDIFRLRWGLRDG